MNPAQLRFHSMLSGTSPVLPRPYWPPVIFKFVLLAAPITAVSAASVGACHVPQRQISSPVSGCPQQPPDFDLDIKTWPFWGRTSDPRLAFAHPDWFWLHGFFPPFPIYGAHQVAPRQDTCIQPRGPTLGSVTILPPYCLQTDQLGTHRMQNISTSSTVLPALIRLVGIRTLGGRPRSLSSWAWDQILRMAHDSDCKMGGHDRAHCSPGGCAFLSRPQSNPILGPRPKQVAYSIYKKDPIFVFHHALYEQQCCYE